jgi:hypothetical protein
MHLIFIELIFYQIYSYWECFRGEIGKTNNLAAWKLMFHPRCIKWERCGSLSIIGLIMHITNDMPILFDKSNLDYLRQQLALSILLDKLTI